MRAVAVGIPEDVLFNMRMSEREAASFAQRMTALGLYGIGGVPLGYCAGIAGMPEEGFVRFLSENGVSVFRFDGEAGFAEELDNAGNAARPAHA